MSRTTSRPRSKSAQALLERLPDRVLNSVNKAVHRKCGGSKTLRLGFDPRRGKSGYVCLDCRETFHLPIVMLGRSEEDK